ncbi:mGluR, partial [Symbiodinium sp. CCMP2456]
PVAGLIGTTTSVVSVPLAILSAGQKVPQVSFGATTPSLSNKESYPYFLRTIPPDSIQSIALLTWLDAFQVHFALCIYSDEAYGRGIYLAMQEQASAAGEPDRLSGHRLRYMAQSFDADEARGVVRLAKAQGSRFVLVAMVKHLGGLLLVLEEEGMLGPDWQILGSEYVGDLMPEDFPVGYMRMNPADNGPKLDDFTGALRWWGRT